MCLIILCVNYLSRSLYFNRYPCHASLYSRYVLSCISTDYHCNVSEARCLLLISWWRVLNWFTFLYAFLVRLLFGKTKNLTKKEMPLGSERRT